MQASPINGEDIEPVILKKYSKKFEDVLITLDEIEYLILNSLTEKEKIQKVKNDIESNIGFLVDAIKRGKYKLRSNNKTKEQTPQLEWDFVNEKSFNVYGMRSDCPVFAHYEEKQ